MPIEPERPIAGPHGLRETDALCQRIDSSHFRVDGRELELPMEIADCSVVLNVFAVDRRAAQRLLDGSGLEVEPVLPGRAALLLMGVDYRDNPLGDYDEAAILLSVRAGGPARSWLTGALEAALWRQDYFVYRMPVSQEFTAHAGRFLWGYPKYLADIDVALGDRNATARMQHDGQPVFAIEAAASTRGRLRERTVRTLTLRHGQLQRTAGSVSGHGMALRIGGAPPVLGDDHPLASELRALGLPARPLLSGSLRHARMRFGQPEPVG